MNQNVWKFPEGDVRVMVFNATLKKLQYFNINVTDEDYSSNAS
jgi:hypothetical protein